MKNAELRGLSLDELRNKLVVERENCGKLKFAHSVTPIENPMRIKAARKLVARIETEIHAKMKQANVEEKSS
ncbi:MAG: 50S ribosomal protein L29 [Bacteroidota bacterium]